MTEKDYAQLYNAIYDTIPEYAVIRTENSTCWTGVETSFGCGMAMNGDSFCDESRKLACANSFYNRGNTYYLPYNTYYAEDIDFHNKTVGIVGNMRGIPNRYGDVCKDIFIFDFESKDCLSVEKEDELLPLCNIVVITGSTIPNGTLPHVLSLCENAYRVLTGPSVPQCLQLLDFGIDMLAGMCVADKDQMFDHIKNNRPGSPYGFGTPFRVKR